MTRPFHILIHTVIQLVVFLSQILYPQESQQVTDGFGFGAYDSSQYYPPDTIQASGRDDPRWYTLGEVVVTAVRLRPTVRTSPSTVTLLSAEDIRFSGSGSLDGLLAQVAGVFIKDYGALSGLKTISQRGLGAEHTLVLINGVRVSSFQNGLLDLGILSMGEVKAVEVVHGGQSAAHGSEAMGGVVNIVTRGQEQGYSLSIASGIGSFGYQKIGGSGGIGFNDVGFRISFFQERSTGNFPFVFRNGPRADMLQRANADIRSRYGTFQGFLNLTPTTRVTSFLQGYMSDRGVPGPVLAPTSSSSARQSDEDYIGQLFVESDVSREVKLSLAGHVHYAYQRYTDPDLQIGQSELLETDYRNLDLRFMPSVTWLACEDLALQLGAELGRTTSTGGSVSSSTARRQGSAFAAAEFELLKQDGVLSTVSLFPSIRFDSFSSSVPAWSPHIGFVATFGEIVLPGEESIRPDLRASFGRNFRVPTFNELYYDGGGGFGNPHLRPERSSTWELGGGCSASVLGRQYAQVAWFRSEMTDRIIWVAAGTMGVTPENIRQVSSEGIEAAWSWEVPGLAFKGDYAYVSSMKTSKESESDRDIGTQLVYVPFHTARVSAACSVPVGSMGIDRAEGFLMYQFVGVRYTTTDNTESLPAYSLLGAGVSIRFLTTPFALNGRIDVHNILEEEYQVLLGYPMPGRSVRFTLGIDY
jgi:outer membrane cobalamin receptor